MTKFRYIPPDVIRREQNMRKKNGWQIIYDILERKFPFNCNFYTSGLRASYNHPELQICLNITTRLVDVVFDGVVEQIMGGKVFAPGMDYTGFLSEDFPVKFVDARLNGHRILRVVIPDDNGNFEGNPYSLQFTKLSDGIPLKALEYRTEDITTTANVESFFRALIKDHDLNFHPDNRFSDYIHFNTDKRLFSFKEADNLEKLIDHCFAVCSNKKDIYGIALKVFNSYIKKPRIHMDKIDPTWKGPKH